MKRNREAVAEKCITVPNPTPKFCMDVYDMLADKCLFDQHMCNIRLLGGTVVIADMLILVGGIGYWICTGAKYITTLCAVIIWILFIIEKIIFKKMNKAYKEQKDKLRSCFNEIKDSRCLDNVKNVE